MTTAEKAESYLVGRIAFPLTNFLFNRRKILSCYDDLCHTQWYEPECIRDIQLQKMRRLITYAYEHIPFYRSRFQAEGLLPGDINSLEDITKIPPLSRQEVIDNRYAMVDSALTNAVAAADRSKRGPGEPIPFAPFRRHRLVRNTSSGSTGAPTVFYEDGSRTALNWALEMRLKSWFDIQPGAREARMVRLSTEYMPASRTIRLRNRLWNQLILPGMNLTDADYADCVQKLYNFRPKILWGITSALAGLAEYVRRKGIDPSPWGVRLITGWAAPVYDHERKVLQEVLSCPVSNIYSAREVGHVAGQCSHGTYHINQEHTLVERDEGDGQKEERETGELLVTTLNISPMPFIRYRMGDIGRTAESKCGCGRKLQVLQDFLGRTGEVFRTRDGRMISPNFWGRTFMSTALSDAIKRFQVVYVRDNLIRIRIVRGKVYSDATERVLREELQKNFPQDMIFTFAYVQEIKPQVSGKYQMVVNEIR